MQKKIKGERNGAGSLPLWWGPDLFYIHHPFMQPANPVCRRRLHIEIQTCQWKKTKKNTERKGGREEQDWPGRRDSGWKSISKSPKRERATPATPLPCHVWIQGSDLLNWLAHASYFFYWHRLKKRNKNKNKLRASIRMQLHLLRCWYIQMIE